MAPSVSAVVATVGRPSLHRAVESVLGQSHRVDEVIVVAPPGVNLALPDDDRIAVLRIESGAGAARSRQAGIDSAQGSVIALLDDDDEWYSDKIEQQLDAARAVPADQWIISSRLEVRGPGTTRRIWPRRLISPGQSVADYLFRFSGFRSGSAVIQTSTLCFPATLARTVRWDAHEGAIHDEPSWLMDAQQAFPDIRLIQLPAVLGVYNVQSASVSRQKQDQSDAYIAWGREYLASASARTRGDYFCTSPVSAAVSARSLHGVRRAVGTAVREGRPGPAALNYALLNACRIVLVRTRARLRR